MARHNHPKHSRRRTDISDRYDTDICFMPHRSHIRTVVAHPLKTIFRNADAAPWAYEKKEIHRFDDDCLRFIMRQKEEVIW